MAIGTVANLQLYFPLKLRTHRAQLSKRRPKRQLVARRMLEFSALGAVGFQPLTAILKALARNEHQSPAADRRFSAATSISWNLGSSRIGARSGSILV